LVGLWKGEEGEKNRWRRVNIVQILYVHIHVCKLNMIPAETIPGMG
jgi:hypothetical protein